MNEIRRPQREADELAAIRLIVERHPAPDFVVGFDIELGIYLNEPAAWIVFERLGDDGLDADELRARARRMNEFTAGLQSDLLRSGDSRFPFFESRSVRSDPAATE